MSLTMLVPFDFSAAAERALRWAAELHRQLGAPPPIVLHVVNPVPAGAAMLPLVTPITDDDLRAIGASVRDVTKPICPDARIEVVLAASPGDAVIREATARKVDLIVMGTHGRGPVARAFVGSVADHVVRNAPCAVATMRAAES